MPDPIDTEAGELKTVPDSRFRLNWPITASFRERVGNEESRGSGGYLARNGNALGAYQLTPIALKDIGWLDSNGNWTEKSGVTDDNAFLFSPLKQEIALKEYLLANRRHAQTNGVLDQVGQTISWDQGCVCRDRGWSGCGNAPRGADCCKKLFRFSGEARLGQQRERFSGQTCGCIQAYRNAFARVRRRSLLAASRTLTEL